MSWKWFKKNKEWATIPLRIILAFLLIMPGYNKLANLAGTAGFFEGLGVPIAIVFALLVGLIEFVGGIMVLIGLFTRYVVALQAVVMVFAILLAHLSGGYEKAALVLLLTVSLMFSGAGQLSVDKNLLKK
ncbi:MAG: DoxX family protein [archaeon]